MGCRVIIDSIEVGYWTTDGKCGKLNIDLEVSSGNLNVKIDVDRNSYHEYTLEDRRGNIIYESLDKREIKIKILNTEKYILKVKERSIYGCIYEQEVGIGISLRPKLISKENKLVFSIDMDIYRINLKIVNTSGNIVYSTEDYNNEIIDINLNNGTLFYMAKVYERAIGDLVLEGQNYIEKVN